MRDTVAMIVVGVVFLLGVTLSFILNLPIMFMLVSILTGVVSLIGAYGGLDFLSDIKLPKRKSKELEKAEANNAIYDMVCYKTKRREEDQTQWLKDFTVEWNRIGGEDWEKFENYVQYKSYFDISSTAGYPETLLDSRAKDVFDLIGMKLITDKKLKQVQSSPSRADVDTMTDLCMQHEQHIDIRKEKSLKSLEPAGSQETKDRLKKLQEHIKHGGSMYTSPDDCAECMCVADQTSAGYCDCYECRHKWYDRGMEKVNGNRELDYDTHTVRSADGRIIRTAVPNVNKYKSNHFKP